jgi:elongation factor P
MDGKLYVVLVVENIHPGKGTPVTQLDMRRISDGVKVSERYRTTETVERAFVDDREYTFLYADGDEFHFMNPQNFEQVTVPKDLVGDAAAYLQWSPCRCTTKCRSRWNSRPAPPSKSSTLSRR